MQLRLAVAQGEYNPVIIKNVSVGSSARYYTKRRFVEERLKAALSKQPRAGAAHKLCSKTAALLVAVMCSNLPSGRALQTLKLLAGELAGRASETAAAEKRARPCSSTEAQTVAASHVRRFEDRLRTRRAGLDHLNPNDLSEMLFVAVCATVSGAEGWSDIVEFAENRLARLRKFVRMENGIPVDDPFARVLSSLNPKALNECFLGWLETLREERDGRVIAIDGKALRHSHDRKRGQHPLLLVRAWATGERMALGCQSEIAGQIIGQRADYVLAVKHNQPQLHEAIRSFMQTVEEHGLSTVAHSYDESTDTVHGRIEIRGCWTFDQLECLPVPERWAGLHSFAVVENECHRAGAVTRERRCFIASVAADASQIARAVRSLWELENGFHRLTISCNQRRRTACCVICPC